MNRHGCAPAGLDATRPRTAAPSRTRKRQRPAHCPRRWRCVGHHRSTARRSATQAMCTRRTHRPAAPPERRRTPAGQDKPSVCSSVMVLADSPRNTPPPAMGISACARWWKRCHDQGPGSAHRGGQQPVKHHAAHQRGGADVRQQHGAIEQGQHVVLAGIVGEQPPGSAVLQRPKHAGIDQGLGGHLVERAEPGAGRPMEGADGNAHHAEQDESGFPRIAACPGDDLMPGRTRRKLDRVAIGAAPAAHMARRRPLHRTDRHQRRAVHRRRAWPGTGCLPGGLIDLVTDRRQLGQYREHAVHRAKIAAPDALVAPVHQADSHGRHRGAAEDQPAPAPGIDRR